MFKKEEYSALAVTGQSIFKESRRDCKRSFSGPLYSASDHVRKESRAWKRIQIWLFRHLMNLYRLTHTSWSEFRSAVWRIRSLHTTGLDQTGVLVGGLSELDESGVQVFDAYANARIRDTQFLIREISWATTADLYVFLLGWTRGMEWRARTQSIACCSNCQKQAVVPDASQSSPSM